MPDSVGLLFDKGTSQHTARDFAGARLSFEGVVAQKSDHAGALAALSSLALGRGDVQASRDFAMRALGAEPQHIAAILALAAAELEERNYAAALSRLQPLERDTNIGPANSAIANSLLGNALDGLKRPAEAFAAYASSNEHVRSMHRAVYEVPGRETAAMCIPRLIAEFRDVPQVRWRTAHAASRNPVFLIGFPRSGTTLLDQILASHPDVESAEEYDFLINSARKYVYARGGLAHLAQVDETELDSCRKDYWQRVAQAGIDCSRPVFIDKLPLNSILLPLIVRLFPGAKLIFALRDPRDVVLSCFRRRFGMNVHMYEFLTLEGAASYYGAVMTLVGTYMQKLGVAMHAIRYEDLVTSPEVQMKKLCTFLGIAWTPSMLDFAGRAQARDLRTPSAAQIARGLYTQGIGQWRAYRKQLEPVLPVLAPWVENFRYAAE